MQTMYLFESIDHTVPITGVHQSLPNEDPETASVQTPKPSSGAKEIYNVKSVVLLSGQAQH